MRSAGRSSSGIARQIARVSLVERQLEPGGELHGAQHAQAVVGERRRIDDAQQRAARGRARPSNGSRYSPVSGSHEIALIVKSRRRAASSMRMAGIAGRRRSRGGRGRPSIRGAAATRRCRRSCRPESSRRPSRRGRATRAARASRSAGTPNTSMSMSFESRPRSRSRTQPPTIERAAAGVADGTRDRRDAQVSSGRSSRSADRLPSPNRCTSAVGQNPGAMALSTTSPRGCDADRPRAPAARSRARWRPPRRPASAAGRARASRTCRIRRVMTSKNSVSVETGIDDRDVNRRCRRLPRAGTRPGRPARTWSPSRRP